MNETITLEYELTESDLNAFCYFYVNKSKGIARIRKRAGIYGIIFLIAAIVVFYWWQDIFTSIICGTVAAFMWIYPSRNYAMAQKLKKNYLETYSSEQLFGRRKVRIDDEGISVESAGSSSSVNWAVINNVGHDTNYIFIYDTPGRNIVIPATAFKDRSEFSRALSIVLACSKNDSPILA
jgi:hypothetical protein